MDRLSKILGAGLITSSLLFVSTPALAADGEINSDLRELHQDNREIRGDRRELRGDFKELKGNRRQLRGDIKNGAGDARRHDQPPINQQHPGRLGHRRNDERR